LVTLDSVTDYVWLFVVAGCFGAVGGFAYELLQVRSRQTGTLELPHRQARAQFVDIGFIASLVLGAIAAIAISYFFTPEVLVKSGPVGNEVITTKWQIVKVVPLSIIVGSAGGAFLTAMQARALAQINEQKAQKAVAVGKATVEQVGAAATRESGAAAASPADRSAEVAAQAVSAIQAQVDLATKAIDRAVAS
jgi:hypothetical protein